MLLGGWTVASAEKTQFTLFDGTNPANKPRSGAICGSGTLATPSINAYTYHVSVSNWSGSTAVLRLTFTDLDFTRYQIPANSSFNLTEEGGSNSVNKDIRFSIEGDATTSGELAGQVSVSGVGTTKVFCVSCDADSFTGAACQAAFPVGGLGLTGPN